MTLARPTLNTKRSFSSSQCQAHYYNINVLEEIGLTKIERLPFSIRILLENVLRHYEQGVANYNNLINVMSWNSKDLSDSEFPFMPSRVLLQDFTGVPGVVDLTSMRAAMERQGLDSTKINPQVPVDLVIDHSVQVDLSGSDEAYSFNVKKEYERNQERYAFLRWAQQAFTNFRVVPPGTGIVHQVNLEYLANVVQKQTDTSGNVIVYPDSLIGTDSHTTMINALSIIGWGVGGIEAEAVLLGQPYYMLLPEVIGFELTGKLQEGTTATDLVLTITEMLRAKGVVGKFVEFFGNGLSNLPLPDRATIANMAPEYGATMGFFPLDFETIKYLENTGRKPEDLDIIEKYAKAQNIYRTDTTTAPSYTDTIQMDMGDIQPTMAGPKRPQDRILLKDMKKMFSVSLKEIYNIEDVNLELPANTMPSQAMITHGSVVISAITSCTNTSNPSVMIGAGLLAKKAIMLGLKKKPFVKTSLAPGSRVVVDYLQKAGLDIYLDKLGFNVVGFGCTTCIGNSGPLPEEIADSITTNDIVAASVLSGNRNFEGRVHPLVKSNYLASPLLVVAYAITGSVNIDLTTEPLGIDSKGLPIHLKDIWPSQQEIQSTMDMAVRPESFVKHYKNVFEGDSNWKSLPIPEGNLYKWDENSTYIKELPLFSNMTQIPNPINDIINGRILAMLGDSITTDHISPAGAIGENTPAGAYLIDHGIYKQDFNTYGSRRGNHEVMVRGTFANLRLRNELVPTIEGGITKHIPSNKTMPIYNASMLYIKDNYPLLIIAGKEYGSGSSRDWAAKGTMLLGIKAVIAESFERIHRSNLVGMGVLPLQFKEGDNRKSLKLTGFETFTIKGLSNIQPREELSVIATNRKGISKSFNVLIRIDTKIEVEYFNHGGVLQYVLRNKMK